MNNPNKPTRINFISNGLLFASAALLAAFSFSEKSIIEKELHKIHSTIIEYQTAVKKEAIIKPKKRKNIPKKENKKKTIDLKSKSSQQIKTTKNKWPTDGIFPLSPTLDTPGPIGRSVKDIKLILLTIELTYA